MSDIRTIIKPIGLAAPGKECPRCKQFKNWNEYPLGVSGQRIHSYCKLCLDEYNKEWRARARIDPNSPRHPKNRRRYHLSKTFGLTVEEYEEIEERQDWKCGICEKALLEIRFPHVDHNHETGRVRGILCFDCNVSLGGFKDNVDLLKKAIVYLENNNG